ncbi:MAG: peptide-methionine (S)-S-oxide reductase MsrA [Tannerellaceae bacterium]|nr:peptide-methionine (S)-S-oxide reductase MsrA [Tannerellaceae bacterium]
MGLSVVVMEGQRLTMQNDRERSDVFHFTGEETALDALVQALPGASIPPPERSNTRIAYFASGCFWGTEYYFMKARGVTSTAAGFMGGHLPNPTYQQVRGGETGHLECVEVTYDATKTSYEDLVKLFFETHDFTQTNGQGPDIGSQYLSSIFYLDPNEKKIAETCIAFLQKQGYRVATRLTPASSFWKAENYHQQYYEHKGEQPYCHSYKKLFR